MIRECIEQHIDQRWWKVLQIAEQSERKYLSELAQEITDSEY